jgi:predicted NodU family carbamoyl transferase
MLNLGINAAFHDSSACIVKDVVVIAAVEEEKFNRVKYAKRSIPLSANSPSYLIFGEPIVCTLKHAIKSFFSSPLDALVIGSYLLKKQ